MPKLIITITAPSHLQRLAVRRIHGRNVEVREETLAVDAEARHDVSDRPATSTARRKKGGAE